MRLRIPRNAVAERIPVHMAQHNGVVRKSPSSKGGKRAMVRTTGTFVLNVKAKEFKPNSPVKTTLRPSKKVGGKGAQSSLRDQGTILPPGMVTFTHKTSGRRGIALTVFKKKGTVFAFLVCTPLPLSMKGRESFALVFNDQPVEAVELALVECEGLVVRS